MAIEATGQETTERSVQPGQDRRPWEGLGFRMEAVPAAPPAAAAQPGQGAPAPNGGQQPQPSDGFRQMFADISDDQWPTVEPHLKNVQAHVTRLEQVAKPFMDAGVQPQEAVQLLNFAQNYNQDPVGVWLSMAETLQQGGVLSDELDFDELVSVVTGQPNPNAVPDESQELQPGADPQIAQLLQRLEAQDQQIKALVDDRQQERTQRQQQQQNALLDRTVADVKEQLKGAGVPEPAEELIIASIIANKGEPGAVVEQFTAYKGGVLETITSNRQEQQPSRPRGVPPVQKPRAPRNARGDAFADARAGATQFLKQANEAAAQEV